MNAMGVAAISVAWLLGAAITATLWPRERRRDDSALIASLGIVVGLGATSALFFFASLVFSRPAVASGLIECVLLGLLLWRLRGGGRQRAEPKFPPLAGARSSVPMGWAGWLLASVMMQAAVLAVVVGIRVLQTEPYGGGDAWAIWNMHARFMLRAGPDWPELLAAGQLSWTHPDYPRLVCASVARGWAWAGHESPVIAGLVSGLFGVATVGLLGAGVARLRGPRSALLGMLMLLATPFFVAFSANQHADVPLAACVLATLVMLALIGHAPARGWAGLAGLLVGCAAWAKNEGLLFAVVVGIAWGAMTWRHGSRAAVKSFLAALAVALVPLVVFKLMLAPPNDLVAAPLGPRLAQMLDPARHRLVWSSLWRDLGKFGEWQVLPFLAMVLPFLAGTRPRFDRSERAAPLIVGLMLAGYLLVYLATPHDLVWHLDSSLVRLLLQLWPAALFAWCLALPDVVDVGSVPAIAKRGMLALNVVLAIGVVLGLSRQPAANELVARSLGAARVSVTLGDGWFELEQHGRDRWAWSQGDAALQLHCDGAASARVGTLRFGLRSLAAREVTVKLGERVLWRGPVADRLVAVEIRELGLAGPLTVVHLVTDAPAVPEPVANGRALAFAIYNVQLR